MSVLHTIGLTLVILAGSSPGFIVTAWAWSIVRAGEEPHRLRMQAWTDAEAKFGCTRCIAFGPCQDRCLSEYMASDEYQVRYGAVLAKRAARDEIDQ